MKTYEPVDAADKLGARPFVAAPIYPVISMSAPDAHMGSRKQLIGEKSDVEKEYLVRVEGPLSFDGLALLNHGLMLDGVALQPAKVSWQNEDQLRFALREGRKRQIRRMCELVGLHVVGLKRVRIGQVKLAKLPPGKWRYLGEHEKF